MQAEIVEIAGEAVVLIPDSVMEALGWTADDQVDVRVEDRRIVIEVVRTAKNAQPPEAAGD